MLFRSPGGETKAVAEMTTRELQQAIKERDKLKSELDQAREAAQTLDQDLRQTKEQLEAERQRVPVPPKPIVIEKIPEDVARELEALRSKVTVEVVHPSEAMTRYRVHFDAMVAGFKALLTDLEEIRSTDEETYANYRTAFAGLLTKMQERL